MRHRAGVHIFQSRIIFGVETRHLTRHAAAVGGNRMTLSVMGRQKALCPRIRILGLNHLNFLPLGINESQGN